MFADNVTAVSPGPGPSLSSEYRACLISFMASVRFWTNEWFQILNLCENLCENMPYEKSKLLHCSVHLYIFYYNNKQQLNQ